MCTCCCATSTAIAIGLEAAGYGVIVADSCVPPRCRPSGTSIDCEAVVSPRAWVSHMGMGMLPGWGPVNDSDDARAMLELNDGGSLILEPNAVSVVGVAASSGPLVDDRAFSPMHWK